MDKKSEEIASIKYKDLKLSANSFVISMTAIILTFILLLVGIIFFYKYKTMQLQQNFNKTKLVETK